jgi:preprotein translocase subunit SecG
MITTLTIVHIVVSILLIFMVLIHFGKGAEAGLVLDTSSSSILPTKGNVLNKITAILVILFLLISLSLAILRGQQTKKSLMDKMTNLPTTAAPVQAAAPVAPTAGAPAAVPAAPQK